jgi:hypothetical protein
MEAKKVLVFAQKGGGWCPDFLAKHAPPKTPDGMRSLIARRHDLFKIAMGGPYVLVPDSKQLPLTTRDAEGFMDAVEVAFDCGVAIHPNEFLSYVPTNALVAHLEWVVPIEGHNPLNARWVRMDSVDDALTDTDRRIALETYEAIVADEIEPTVSADNPVDSDG